MSNFDEKAVDRIKKLEREVERLRVKESPDMSSYLGITAKAADSAKLGGVNASDLLSGWIPASGWTINDAANGAVNVPSGALSIYSVGDKVKLTNQTVKYFYIVRVEDNYMFLNGGSNYVLSGAYGTALTDVYYSHATSPLGFPQWFNWTATKSAQWTETGTVTWTTRYTKIGKIVTVSVRCFAVGGSIALSSMGYITLPFAVSTTGSGTGVVVTGLGVQLGVAMAYPNSSNLYFSTFSAMSNEFFLTLTYEAA